MRVALSISTKGSELQTNERCRTKMGSNHLGWIKRRVSWRVPHPLHFESHRENTRYQSVCLPFDLEVTDTGSSRHKGVRQQRGGYLGPNGPY